jgi:hypothetical protein
VRAVVGEVAGDSGDDTAPPNGFDDILNEVCEETALVSDESDEEAWGASCRGLDAGPGLNTGKCTSHIA